MWPPLRLSSPIVQLALFGNNISDAGAAELATALTTNRSVSYVCYPHGNTLRRKLVFNTDRNRFCIHQCE